MNLIRCNNCNRIANSIFLDVDGNCLGCSIYYGYDNRKEVFDKLVTNYHPFGWTWEEWRQLQSNCLQLILDASLKMAA